MFRGITRFHCTECGNNFNAPDYEYAATVYSMPQPCLKCGSIRTLPKRFYSFPWIFLPLALMAYKNIWKNMQTK